LIVTNCAILQNFSRFLKTLSIGHFKKRALPNRRRTLQYKDLLDAVTSSDQCDFLVDVIAEFNVRA